jgi:transcriptional regulator with XRE-family HTH domain
MIINNSERYKNIGIKIAENRTRRGLTQQQLADRIGISKSYLSKIESPNTVKSFSLDVLFSISDELGIKITDLFEDVKK